MSSYGGGDGGGGGGRGEFYKNKYGKGNKLKACFLRNLLFCSTGKKRNFDKSSQSFQAHIPTQSLLSETLMSLDGGNNLNLLLLLL
jgi:hypothetical protein